MKAMVLREFNQPLREEEVPLPATGEEDVLVKVGACGVCYTDVKISSGAFSYISLPRIMGHEIAGEIAAYGAKVKDLREGDRVCVYFYLNCGQCENCRAHRENLCQNLRGRLGYQFDGGYAEYVSTPAAQVLKVPPGIPIEEAAILADAVATPLHALRSQARIQPGETAAVWGIGGLGIHAVQLARVLGARVLAVDLDEKKMQAAREWGAEVFHGSDPKLTEAILSATRGRGADVVLDVVGKNETFQSSLAILKPAGRYVIVGYSFDKPYTFFPHRLVTNEFVMMGSRASTRGDLADVLKWTGEKKIKPMVSRHFPLREANDALEGLKKNTLFHRVVLKP